MHEHLSLLQPRLRRELRSTRTQETAALFQSFMQRAGKPMVAVEERVLPSARRQLSLGNRAESLQQEVNNLLHPAAAARDTAPGEAGKGFAGIPGPGIPYSLLKRAGEQTTSRYRRKITGNVWLQHRIAF